MRNLKGLASQPGLCPVSATPARPLALSWGKREALQGERAAFKSRVCQLCVLGKVLSLSEPQFVHLSNGLVIPSCMVATKAPGRFPKQSTEHMEAFSSHRPLTPGRGFAFTFH